MHSGEIYPITMDEATGRAHVLLSGEIDLFRVQNTFIIIAINETWLRGNRSVIWQFENARFPAAFEFGEILKKAQMAKNFTKPGKSAIVLEKDSEQQKSVSGFYQSLAEILTERQISLFDNLEEAQAWLDTRD